VSPLRDNEDGFTLIELLLVCSLFIVILSATLLTFNEFERHGAKELRRLEQVETARRGLEHFARQARNVAKQSSTGVNTINRAQPRDVIFQTSDPTRTWVRYCLDTDSPATSPTNGILWMFENAAGLGDTDSCAADTPGWTRGTTVAHNVVNVSESRPVFSYVCAVGVSDCTSSDDLFERINGFHGDLRIDIDPARTPEAMQVSTAVFLRNQNQKPTPRFTVTRLGTQQVLLNASGSTDPEGRTLRFYWFHGSAPTFTCEQGPPESATHWTGATLAYTFAEPSGTENVPLTLVVCDPGDLQSEQTQLLQVPT
jgi:type II secretory pathway pseudopilin PulG